MFARLAARSRGHPRRSALGAPSPERRHRAPRVDALRHAPRGRDAQHASAVEVVPVADASLQHLEQHRQQHVRSADRPARLVLPARPPGRSQAACRCQILKKLGYSLSAYYSSYASTYDGLCDLFFKGVVDHVDEERNELADRADAALIDHYVADVARRDPLQPRFDYLVIEVVALRLLVSCRSSRSSRPRRRSG